MAHTIKSEHYNIYIDQGNIITNYLEQLKPSKVFVIVDQNTEQLCLYQILEDLPAQAVIIQIEAGEAYKNISTAEFVWASLLKNGADRHSLIINLGGGVVGDLGGFCAATFMRGIKFIQMPTTLLSQVDASVGSKLGVDLDGKKNIIGVFAPPAAVIINTKFLDTLAYKQVLNGFAEVVKHCLIRDAKKWNKLKEISDFSTLNFEELIHHSITIKNDVVSVDPKEDGLRKILNFGHTFGHAIESALMDTVQSLSHGESVAIGMICEAYLSHLKGFIKLEECNEISAFIIGFFGHKYKSLPKFEVLFDNMKYDKKNRSGGLRFSLLQQIGQGNYDIEVDEGEARESYEYYFGLK